MRQIAPVTLLVALALSIGLAPDSAPAAPHLCANAYGGDVVYARHLNCTRARQVVRAWARDFKRSGRPSTSSLGFICHGRDDPVEGLVVFCRRARKRVTFFANVP